MVPAIPSIEEMLMIDPRPASFIGLTTADADNAGVVHQYVDAAVLVDGGAYRRCPILGFGDVEMHVAGRGAELCRHRFALVVENIAEHHLGPLSDHRPHVGSTHPARAATNERDLSPSRSATAFLLSKHGPDAFIVRFG